MSSTRKKTSQDRRGSKSKRRRTSVTDNQREDENEVCSSPPRDDVPKKRSPKAARTRKKSSSNEFVYVPKNVDIIPTTDRVTRSSSRTSRSTTSSATAVVAASSSSSSSPTISNTPPVTTTAYMSPTPDMSFSMYQSHFNSRLSSLHNLTAHYQMIQMLDASTKMANVNNYPVHPDVRFKRLPFYDMIGELIKPSTLFNNNLEYRTQDFHFNFTPQEAALLAENDVLVQLRFCLLETSCEQDDCFPPNLAVKVNGKFCQLPMPIPSNKAVMEPKRPPGPVHINHLIKRSAVHANNLSITWKTDYVRQYALCVSLVRMLTSSQLLTRLKNKGTKHPDFTRSLIKEKLREDLDCEIATTSLRVSLVCPLGKMRMVVPCRPATCLHLQCFDASLFLQMNERKPSWTCPVCDKPALYDVLVIDGYFQNVLNSPRLDSNCTEIQLHKDGSWSVHSKEPIQETTVNESNTTNVDLIQDDTDVIPLSDGSESSTGLPSIKRSGTAYNEGSSGGDVVVLISDDSDDDDLPLKKRSPNPPDVTDSVSIEVPCDPAFITADSTTSQDFNDCNDSVMVTGVYTNQDRSESIITLDSPSPTGAPGSPAVEVTATPSPPQAIVAPFHPEPDPEPPQETPEANEQELVDAVK